MKIAHEAPKSIFAHVQRQTDYDYALVHLFETDPVYYRLFKDAVIQGREVILDNSIFELGTAFDSSKYVHWINDLKPTWFIIPDVLEDARGTEDRFDDWMKNYDHLVDSSVKRIGVVQGKNYDDVVECYRHVEPKVDKVAISFDYSMYDVGTGNKWQKYMRGRHKLIEYLLDNKIINKDKPHHLLGCALPQEFRWYKHSSFNWIDSIDTSNPVVHGLNLVKYTDNGLDEKISTKLIEYMDEEVSKEQLEVIDYNIKVFRSFCK